MANGLKSSAQVRLVLSFEVGSWPSTFTADRIYEEAKGRAVQKIESIVNVLQGDHEGLRVVGKPVVLLVSSVEESGP